MLAGTHQEGPEGEGGEFGGGGSYVSDEADAMLIQVHVIVTDKIRI